MRRRPFLGAVGAVAGSTAGCLGVLGGGSGSKPAPVDLSGEKRDDRGGMVIGEHGGPNGQVFYAENAPDHGNPAWFHTLARGLFPYYFEHRQRGWTAEAVYVTDYSVVDPEVVTIGGKRTLPAPTAPETFGDAEAMTYVMGGDVLGGMGPELVPFSDEGDAGAYVDVHGGETVGFDDVTPELLASYEG